MEAYKELGVSDIENRIMEILELKSKKIYEAAFLLSWATLQASMRKKARQEKLILKERDSYFLIKEMFYYGLINQLDYEEIRKAMRIRNFIIYGYQPVKINFELIDKLISLIKKFNY